MEELDYTKLFNAYSRKGRNSKVSPINLFKILSYSYMNNIYSSIKIELACKSDINFMWLLEGAPAPDNNTIARFRTGGLQNVIKDLFTVFFRCIIIIGIRSS
ncbi:MAG: transposase [Clostridium sp.]|uniref:transposase n=1 Tax=Clostridium sp. TaxID=1506 RepID=UPI002FCA18DE